MKKKDRLIVVPTGGLANRMRAMASGLSLANFLSRTLQVIWHKDTGLNARFDDLFKIEEIPFEIKNKGDILYNFNYDLPRKKNLFIPDFLHLLDSKEWIYQIGNKARLTEAEDLERYLGACPKDVVIVSCSEFFPYENELLKEIFKFSDKVENRKREILGSATPEISMHIRRSDNVLSINKSPNELFEKEIEKELKTGNDKTIYLATDDSATKKYFRTKYPANIIVNDKEARRDSLEGMTDAAAEMAILSDTEIIFGSYWSSYSEMAAKLGEKNLKILHV